MEQVYMPYEALKDIEILFGLALVTVALFKPDLENGNR